MAQPCCSAVLSLCALCLSSFTTLNLRSHSACPYHVPNPRVCFLFSRPQVNVNNVQLTKLPSDFLYHIGFSSEDPLEKMFGDVKVSEWENVRHPHARVRTRVQYNAKNVRSATFGTDCYYV